MGWVTAIRKHKRALIAYWQQISPSITLSRLGLAIVGLNAIAAGFLIVGMLIITENRRTLVDAQLLSLQAQAEIIANVISDTVVSGASSGPVLDNQAARQVLRRLSPLYIPDKTRAVLYAPGPVQLADSDLIAGAVQQSILPPTETNRVLFQDMFSQLFVQLDTLFTRVSQTEDEYRKIQRTLEEEALAVLKTGQPYSGIRRTPEGSRVVSVTIPIQYVRAVIGTVTYESYELDRFISDERKGLMPFILASIFVLLLNALLLTRHIARPMRKLASAAREVRLAGGQRIALPKLKGRKDEIGEMARAFWAMTNALFDRLAAIESFAADVSHEIKNPLTSIRSAAEVLPFAKTDEARMKLINVIQHDVTRLDRLITDISNISRLDAELARENLDNVNLSKLLVDIAGFNHSDMVKRDIKIELGFDRNMSANVKGHENPLGRVFINLIENAVTFSPDHGHVFIKMRRLTGSHGQILIEIEDQGPGIPEDNLEAVFERFYTARPEGAAFGAHSGLGLSIVKQIITAHGGLVWAENRINDEGVVTGARFIVSLPSDLR